MLQQREDRLWGCHRCPERNWQTD